MALTNSKRVLHKASYVQIELTADEQHRERARPGRALEKVNLIRQLAIQPDDIRPAIAAALAVETKDQPAQSLAKTADDRLALLRQAETRLQSVQQFHKSNQQLAPIAMLIPADVLVAAAERAAERLPASAQMLNAVAVFRRRMTAAPVGRIHLERLEMYPAGEERGELMFTVPMAPRETVTISHKEWSTTSEEYERIVQDVFESYSERGVAEKTDVSMSTESESKHGSTFNFSANLSGSIGPVSLSTSTGLTLTSEDRQALKQSTQQTREMTFKASARSRQEHKISSKLETKKGVEDSSYRTISNPSKTQVMRVDYYRMMRKWRTDHYRYGLRLTFDLAVPLPGARLWALHQKIHKLDSEIAQPFEFTLAPENVSRETWTDLQEDYRIALEPPLPPHLDVITERVFKDSEWGEQTFQFVAPPNYIFVAPQIEGKVSYWGPGGRPTLEFSSPHSTVPPVDPGGNHGTFEIRTAAFGDGERCATFLVRPWEFRLVVLLKARALLRSEIYEGWRLRAWTALRDAAIAKHNANIAAKQAERDKVWMELSAKDTLSLRRLEREELMRSTLYWIFGHDFDVTPPNAATVFIKLVNSERNQMADSEPGADQARKLTAFEWGQGTLFGEMVKFIHHAIEWENLLYFLYPYFWGSDDLAREKMLFEHPDANHRDFLRASFARVVVPVRPGFEERFTKLVTTGVFSELTEEEKEPYITLAEEVAAYARTNYVGIPPANPERHARPLLYPEQRQTWRTMEAVVGAIEQYHDTHSKYPASLSALGSIMTKDFWGRELEYTLPGTGNDYDLISRGADGVVDGDGLDADISAGAGASLVASWFDFTPTSAIDIDIKMRDGATSSEPPASDESATEEPDDSKTKPEKNAEETSGPRKSPRPSQARRNR